MSETSHVPDGILRAIFERTHEAIGVSRDGAHVAVNPAYLKLFGYDTVDQLIGEKTVLDLIAPDSRPAILEKIRRRSTGLPVPPSYLTRGLRRDGTEFDLSVHVADSPAGDGAPYTIVILADVTDQLRAQKEIADSRAFYRAIFEVNTAVKLILDPEDGRIIDANPAAVAFYGWSLAELRTMRISQINTLPEDVVLRELRAAREEDRRYFRFQHRRAGGDVRDVDIYSGPFDVGGRRLLMSIIHDVTERQLLEQRLHSGQRMEAVGRLAGGIAHDFNNLLAVVLANAEMLHADLPGAGPAATRLGRIVAASQRAEVLTRRLLALARRQVLRPERLRLADIALRIEDLARSALGDVATLEVDIDSASGFVWADASQLDQVLLNLITNARDAVSVGGHVRLKVYDVDIAAEQPLAVEVGPGAWVCVEVADDGAGMDEATRAQVFEPFFTTKVGVGTGLGLATVYGIVEQSRGRVLVDSTLGEGSRFRVFLPRLSAASPRVPPARVLLVEDEEGLRHSLGDRLLAVGHTVLQAADGEAALGEAERIDALDLVVCDVDLPSRSGPEVVDQLRERWPDLAAVLVSGATGAPPALSERMTLLPKPFSLGAFDAAVVAALASRRR